MMNGLLLLDKPEGLRSTECVALVRRAFGKKSRVGHAGTLDSTASGLLVIMLGTATRLSDYVMALPKLYRARVRLGVSTDTCDYSGEPLFFGDPSNVDEALFDNVLYSFYGARMQVPPGISALKIKGVPAHRLMRSGQEAVLAARTVVVTSITRCEPLKDNETVIEISCSKGTYVRSIVRDLGDILGCGAHLAGLRRLTTGSFSVEQAVSPKSEGLQNAALFHPREVGAHFHRIILTEAAERRLANGLPVSLLEAGRYEPGSADLSFGLCVEGSDMMGFADLVTEDGTYFLKPRANIFYKGSAV